MEEHCLKKEIAYKCISPHGSKRPSQSFKFQGIWKAHRKATVVIRTKKKGAKNWIGEIISWYY